MGPLWGRLGASWGPHWGSWGFLGASWGHLGALLGALQALLGPVWRISIKELLFASPPLSRTSRRLGPSWGALGGLWGALGAVLGQSWGPLWPSWSHLEASGAHRKRNGENARISCPPFVFGRIWASWGHHWESPWPPGLILGPSCGLWGHLGGHIEPTWTILRYLGRHLKTPGAILEPSWAQTSRRCLRKGKIIQTPCVFQVFVHPRRGVLN